MEIDRNRSIITTYNNIALVYKDKGNCTYALEYYQKALTIQETKLGKDHTDTAITYTNIGSLQYQMCTFQEGLDNLLKAFLIFVTKFGFEHPNTEAAFNWLPDCYHAAYPDGEPFLKWIRKQLEICAMPDN